MQPSGGRPAQSGLVASVSASSPAELPYVPVPTSADALCRRRPDHNHRFSPEQAKALAERAAAHFNDVGPDKAIADFNDAAGCYVDRELFVVVYDPDRKIKGSYGIPALRDKDATLLKAVEGKAFGRDIIALSKSQGSGWVEYRMTNPATHKVGLKKSWDIGLSGAYILFVGAFGG